MTPYLSPYPTSHSILHPHMHTVDHAADAAHGPPPQEGEPQPAPTHLPCTGCDSDRRHHGVRAGFVCFLRGRWLLS